MEYNDVINLVSTGVQALLVFIGILLLVCLIFLILYIVGLCKVFKKAGYPVWAAIIPFYSTYIFTRIAGLHWMYFLFLISGAVFSALNITGFGVLASLLFLYADFMCCYNLSKKFGRDTGFAVLMLFFMPIVIFVMGISKDFLYDDNVIVSEHGVFGGGSSNSNQKEKTDDEVNFCNNCGAKINSKYDRFCPKCGKEIN